MLCALNSRSADVSDSVVFHTGSTTQFPFMHTIVTTKCVGLVYLTRKQGLGSGVDARWIGFFLVFLPVVLESTRSNVCIENPSPIIYYILTCSFIFNNVLLSAGYAYTGIMRGF